MSVERYTTYVPPSTDTSYGSNSNHTPMPEPMRDHTKIERTSVSLRDPNMVTLPGGLVTSRAAAEAAGLLVPGANPMVPATTGEHFTPAAQPSNEAKAAAAKAAADKAATAKIHQDHNNALDDFESQFESHDQYREFIDEAIAGNDEALAVVPPAVVRGFTTEAQRICSANGLANMDAMGLVLDEESRQAALSALVSGNEAEFTKYVSRTIQEARNLAHDEGFQEMVEEAGGRIDGTDLIFDGKRYDVGRAVLAGIIKFS